MAEEPFRLPPLPDEPPRGHEKPPGPSAEVGSRVIGQVPFKEPAPVKLGPSPEVGSRIIASIFLALLCLLGYWFLFQFQGGNVWRNAALGGIIPAALLAGSVVRNGWGRAARTVQNNAVPTEVRCAICGNEIIQGKEGWCLDSEGRKGHMSCVHPPLFYAKDRTVIAEKQVEHVSAVSASAPSEVPAVSSSVDGMPAFQSASEAKPASDVPMATTLNRSKPAQYGLALIAVSYLLLFWQLATSDVGFARNLHSDTLGSFTECSFVPCTALALILGLVGVWRTRRRPVRRRVSAYACVVLAAVNAAFFITMIISISNSAGGIRNSVHCKYRMESIGKHLLEHAQESATHKLATDLGAVAEYEDCYLRQRDWLCPLLEKNRFDDGVKPTKAWVNANSSFVYLGGNLPAINTIKADPSKIVVLHDRLDQPHDWGSHVRIINILMLDGKVRDLPVDEAKQVIEKSAEIVRGL